MTGISIPDGLLLAMRDMHTERMVAIFAEDDTPEDWRKYIDMNYEYFGLSR